MSIKSTTDILTCPVCRQLFNSPRFLPCYHFYCEECLENLQVHSEITCPECRNESKVPLGGVKQLQSNFFVKRLVEELIVKRTKEGDEEVQCDNCDENDFVVAYCPSCSAFLCEVCYRYHKRDRLTRKHGIVALSEIVTIPDQAIVKTLQCKEHGSSELQYYCETCNELICVYCTVKEHKDHNHNTVKKMADKCRHEMNKSLTTIKDMFENLSELYNNIEAMMVKIKEQEFEVLEEIDQHYDTLVDQLLQQREEKKQEVYKIHSQKVKCLTMQLEKLSSMQMQFREIMEQHDAVKKSNNPDELFLFVQKQMTTDTKQLMQDYECLDKQPVELDTMQFFGNEVSLPQFGQVLSEVDPRETELSVLPNYGFQDVPIELSITAKYSNGCNYPRGGSNISVKPQLLGDAIGIVPYVKDNQNGTYAVIFTVKQVGKVTLSVFLNEKQIKDTPCSITIGRNYPGVSKPSDILNISAHGSSRQSKPWGIAFGENGVWAVADCTNHCIYMLQEGRQLWKFGSKGSGDGLLDNPCGIAFDNNNYLYVTDYNNRRVQKFDISGNYILQFTGTESGDGCLNTPVDITVHEEMVYVTDSTTNCVVKFYPNGEFCQVIGKGYLNNPNGVMVSFSNHLLVTNFGDNCVYKFTLDGEYLDKFGSSGDGKGQLSGPRSITSDSNGFILITDTGNHRVSIFDKDGKYVHCFGHKGTGTNQFLNPRGIALAPNGSIYISDNLNKCIKIFEV